MTAGIVRVSGGQPAITKNSNTARVQNNFLEQPAVQNLHLSSRSPCQITYRHPIQNIREKLLLICGCLSSVSHRLGVGGGVIFTFNLR